jgi:hypothetical protein
MIGTPQHQNFPFLGPLKITPYGIIGSGIDISFMDLDFFRACGLLGGGHSCPQLSWDSYMDS